MSEQINEVIEDAGVGETRQRILDAALKVFVEQGYKGATTRRIAQEADVNEVTIFRHFGNKLKLIEAVLENIFDGGEIERVIQEQLTGDIRTDLQLLMKHFIGGMRKNWETMHLLICEVHRIPELHEVMHRKAEAREESFRVYFQEQIERGVLRADLSPELILYSFRGSTFAYGRHLRSSEDIITEDVDKDIAQLVDILLNGFMK